MLVQIARRLYWGKQSRVSRNIVRVRELALDAQRLIISIITLKLKN